MSVAPLLVSPSRMRHARAGEFQRDVLPARFLIVRSAFRSASRVSAGSLTSPITILPSLASIRWVMDRGFQVHAVIHAQTTATAYHGRHDAPAAGSADRKPSSVGGVRDHRRVMVRQRLPAASELGPPGVGSNHMIPLFMGDAALRRDESGAEIRQQGPASPAAMLPIGGSTTE